MAIKKYKATSPGLRSMSVLKYSDVITKTTPEKSLTVSLNQKLVETLTVEPL